MAAIDVKEAAGVGPAPGSAGPAILLHRLEELCTDLRRPLDLA